MKKQKNPELSCIIITLNEEKYLPRLLNSLKKQTFKDFEVIVADANSKDKTRQVALKYGCKIAPGGKQSFARNSGAKIAKGKYLLFLDADGMIKNKDFLKLNLEEIKKSKAGVASTYVKPLSRKAIDKILYGIYNLWVKGIKKISPHGTGACILIKKSVFEKVNGFDEKVVFAEDHELLKRAKKHKFIILPVEIHTSTRRLEKEGRPKIILKFLYAGMYRMFYKEISRNLFSYDKTEK